MYSTFIKYEKEYDFYSSILKKYNKNEVLEVGCGSGNLTKYFESNDFKYRGMDISADMLEIARNRNPNSLLIEKDMRFFTLEQVVDSVIMAGRTISYLVSNEDVVSAFRSIYNSLEVSGLFCFDFIDASQFIPLIEHDKLITHEAHFNDVHYIRNSKWSVDLSGGWCFNWESKFFKKEENKSIEIGEDNSTIRTFLKDEIELLLRLNGFEIKEMIPRSSYAFPTYVAIAEKKPYK